MLSLIPIALVLILSLKTKNIYISLILGIILAVAIHVGFDPLATVNGTIEVFGYNADRNMNILIYVTFLGMFIYLMGKSGAAAYFANKLIKRVNTKRKAVLMTSIIGILCFIDDYFSLLTTNTATQAIADKNGVSRTKLAYLMDATASPICVIAPIGSWVGLIAASLPATSQLNGFGLYLSTIPFAFYSLFTIVFLLVLGYLNFDFGKMRRLEEKATKELAKHHEENINPNVRVKDLILPIITIMVVTGFMMLFTGGMFEGVSPVEAFMNCDAVTSLAVGSGLTILLMALLYVPRKVLDGRTFINSITDGFEFISVAILTLILAWTFSTVCGSEYLDFTGFVQNIILENNIPFELLPFGLFVTCFVATVCTGSSWTAIALLIPLSSTLFNDTMTPLMILSTAAIMAGGVAGDQLGPLTDTTVLSASITQSDYMDHVTTQLTYGIPVVIVSALAYLISGLTGIMWLGLVFGIIVIPIILKVIKMYVRRKYGNC